MKLAERQQALDTVLQQAHGLWHPQPFRQIRPPWTIEHAALTSELLALDEGTVAHLNHDAQAASQLLAKYIPEIAEFAALSEIPVHVPQPLAEHGSRWAWEIPGRKQSQIEAFAAAARPTDLPVLDWCAGKGHLGRLLALQWTQNVISLEIDATLCAAGEQLAAKSRVKQKFACENALTVTDTFQAGQHAVALHACGDLHRRLITGGAEAGVARFDVVPCCYYRGVADVYQPLSGSLQTRLTRDDARLAVTETVTASPRLTRQRDKEMAWKLGFDALRRQLSQCADYRSFKPVPSAWFRADFAQFTSLMAQREKLTMPPVSLLADFEQRGWQRQREVMRLSIVRHAFRRPLEIWLVLDLACYLEQQAYTVNIGSFCERQLTPRNVLISAQH